MLLAYSLALLGNGALYGRLSQYADPANFVPHLTYFSHLLNLPWTSTNNSRPKFAKSVQPFSSFGETNEQQLIFIYKTRLKD
uniref:SFRICE_008739 n=1 Tax=Spodoptera frugiperda TaxID=7108 RepID=A0A2H1VKU8_SPOFR